jgi:hypothetical protein
MQPFRTRRKRQNDTFMEDRVRSVAQCFQKNETQLMRRILIAIRPDDTGMMTDALGAEFDPVVCFSLADACARLDPGIDLIACGLHFDDGKMFEFLKYVKADPATRPIPFFCVKGAGGPLSRAIYQSIVISTETLGASGFVDLSELISKLGEAQTYKLLRDTLHDIVLPAKAGSS